MTLESPTEPHIRGPDPNFPPDRGPSGPELLCGETSKGEGSQAPIAALTWLNMSFSP
jgi:hypothetical protein